MCHSQKVTGGSCTGTTAAPEPGLKPCTTGTLTNDCGGNTAPDPATNTCGITKTCAQVSTDGDCTPSTGLCS